MTSTWNVPPASSPEVRRRMQAVRRRDTAAEMRVRSEVHRRGLRYRVDAPLPPSPRRRADLLFPRARVAVFVDGCFWHGCPSHGADPKSNAAYWRQKVATNRARDADTDTLLRAAGWLVLRFWEHDDPAVAADRIEAAVRRATFDAAQRLPRAG